MKNLHSLFLASAFLAGFCGSSLAGEREGVVVSIKPLHSIVSAVMQGVGKPKLIVQGAGSEHVYSLKPSDAEAIEHAKVIFWAGPSMETFFDKPIDTLGEGAKVVALGDAKGLTKLKFREGGPFEAHDHGHGGAMRKSMTHMVQAITTMRPKSQKKAMNTTITANMICISGLTRKMARFWLPISPKRLARATRNTPRNMKRMPRPMEKNSMP